MLKDNMAVKCRPTFTQENHHDFFFFFSILCRAAFNAAYSHTGGQARELVRS